MVLKRIEPSGKPPRNEPTPPTEEQSIFAAYPVVTAAIGAVLLVLIGGTIWLLATGNDDEVEAEPATVAADQPTATPDPVATSTPAPSPTPEPTPTAEPTPEPTSTPQPQPTATPAPDPTPTIPPEPTATPAPTFLDFDLALMFPEPDEIQVPVERVSTERITDPFPREGFLTGERFTWGMSDFNLHNQSFLLLEVTCVKYESWQAAAEWIVGFVDRNEIILTGITRNEAIDNLGDQAHAMSGSFGSSDSVQYMAHVFMRLGNTSCMYLGMDQEYDSTDQLIEMVQRIEPRVLEQVTGE